MFLFPDPCVYPVYHWRLKNSTDFFFWRGVCAVLSFRACRRGSNAPELGERFLEKRLP